MSRPAVAAVADPFVRHYGDKRPGFFFLAPAVTHHRRPAPRKIHARNDVLNDPRNALRWLSSGPRKADLVDPRLGISCISPSVNRSAKETTRKVARLSRRACFNLRSRAISPCASAGFPRARQSARFTVTSPFRRTRPLRNALMAPATTETTARPPGKLTDAASRLRIRRQPKETRAPNASRRGSDEHPALFAERKRRRDRISRLAWRRRRFPRRVPYERPILASTSEQGRVFAHSRRRRPPPDNDSHRALEIDAPRRRPRATESREAPRCRKDSLKRARKGRGAHVARESGEFYGRAQASRNGPNCTS